MMKQKTPSTRAPKSALKERSFVSMKRSASIELIALIVTGAVTACGALIMSPVLPFYAMLHGDATALEWSMISSGYSTCQMISAPLLGMLSDKVGRRPVLLAGILTSSILYYVLAEADNPAKLFWIRSALGFAGGIEPVEIAYISDLTSKEDRPRWINLQMSIEAAGAFVGPAIGAVLAPNGFPFLCYVMTCVYLLNFILGVMFFTEPEKLKFARRPTGIPRTQSSALGSSLAQRTLKHFKHRITGPLLIAAFLDSFALAISDGPEAYFLKDKFDFQELDLGKLFMVCSASTLTISNILPRLPEKAQDKRACVGFSLCAAAAMTTMLWNKHPLAPYIYGFLVSVSSSVVEIISKTALLSKMVSENERGAIYGLECALLSAGFSVGAPLGGCLYDWTNTAMPYLVSSFFFCLSAVAYSSLPKTPRFAASEALLAVGRQESEDDDDDKGAGRLLEHHSNAVPLPNKRFATGLVADKARRVFFVDQELYAHFTEEDSYRLSKSHSIGVASMAVAIESSKDLRGPGKFSRGYTVDY